MSGFWFGFVLHVWNRMRTAEVRSRRGEARPQGLAWTGSPRFAYDWFHKTKPCSSCRRPSDRQLGRAAPFGCLRGQFILRVLRNHVGAVANGHAPVQMFMDHHLCCAKNRASTEITYDCHDVDQVRRHQPIGTRDADHRVSISQVSVFSWIWFPSRRLSATSAHLDRGYLVLRIDEDGRCCNDSPILEACASDEIHSAVSHNPSTLAGCFRLIVRKKHLPWAHVPVISTLRYPSAQVPRPNQERRSCVGRGAETCVLDLRAALPVAVVKSTPPSGVPWH
jgi:hypothetical protein